MELPATGQPVDLGQSKGGRGYRTSVTKGSCQSLNKGGFASAQVAYQLNYLPAAQQPCQPCGELGGILWPGR